MLLIFSSAGCALRSSGPEFPRLEPDYNAKRKLDFSPFAAELRAFSARRAAALDALLLNRTIDQIQQLLHDRRLTSVELSTWYLDRIRATT